MSARKRTRTALSTNGPPAKGRAVQVRTVEKWVAENNKVLKALIWLKFEGADRDVLSLKCAVCSRFNDKLVSMWNYSPAFVKGTTNVRTSSFKEHAATDLQACAMVLFKKQQSSTVCEYAPITKVLLQPSTNDHTKASLKQKFDIAYMIAKNKLAFINHSNSCWSNPHECLFLASCSNTALILCKRNVRTKLVIVLTKLTLSRLCVRTDQ